MIVLKNMNKNNFFFLFQKNNIICFFLAAAVFFLDRLSKYQVINQQLNDGRIYINDYLNLDLTWNTGVAFGFLSSSSNIIYKTITFIIAFVIIILIYLIVVKKIIDKISFSLVLGGALGNFYDRSVYFAVPDFIDVHYKNFHWFTFNIADIFITLGIIILISNDLLTKK